jgi:NO-binding membrane sensor protein with MHYT domain/GGDEF domain-containing protein
MANQQWVQQSALASDGIARLLAFAVVAICAYAAVVLLQRAQQGRSGIWLALSAFALSSGIATLHFISLADLPAAAGAHLGGLSFVVSLLACAGIGASAIHGVSRDKLSASAQVFYAVMIGVGLCTLADRGLAAASFGGGETSYNLSRIVPTLAAALIGSVISLSILRGLRTMPERSILPPRPLAGLFIGTALTLTQSGIFHAALLPDIAAPISILPLWLPLAMSAAVLATMAVLIQFARRDEASSAAASAPAASAAMLLEDSTQLPLRARFMREAPIVIQRAARLGRELELIRCEVQGQHLLDALNVERIARIMAQRLTAMMQSGDLLARHDRFEFVLLRQRAVMQVTTTAAMVLQDLCAPLDMALGTRNAMTILAGVAEYPRDGADIRSLLLTAAQASQTAQIADAVIEIETSDASQDQLGLPRRAVA